tara:strand:+ start:6072 stop:7214 length:1143 start_codon:yes stop_codon:yes gene_type:complete
MDPVYLTEEMIQQFNLRDAVAGDLASMQDLEIMGLISKTDDTTGLPILPPRTNAVIDPEVNAITNDALNAVNNTNIDPNIKPPIDQNVNQANELLSNQNLLNLMMNPRQEPKDLFSNLTKDQRMMLAFSAIKDAGMTLQGQEGNTTVELLNNFRKAAAATQAREAMANSAAILQGAGTPQQKLQFLTNELTSGRITPEMYNALTSQINRELQTVKQQVGGIEGAQVAINTVEEMQRLISDNPNLTTGFFGSILKFAPFTKAAELETLSDTLRSKMALGALRALKMEGGATLGAVSEKELNLLESDIAKLKVGQRAGFMQDQLAKIKTRYESIIKKAYKLAEADPTLKAELTRHFGADASALLGDAEPLSLEQIKELYGGG